MIPDSNNRGSDEDDEHIQKKAAKASRKQLKVTGEWGGFKVTKEFAEWQVRQKKILSPRDYEDLVKDWVSVRNSRRNRDPNKVVNH